MSKKLKKVKIEKKEAEKTYRVYLNGKRYEVIAKSPKEAMKEIKLLNKSNG